MAKKTHVAIEIEWTPAEKKILDRLAINPSGFVLDPETGHSFTANPTGAFLLRLLQSEAALDRLFASVQTVYAVTRHDFETDLLDFVETIRSQLA